MKVKMIFCDVCGEDITKLHQNRAKMISYFYDYSKFHDDNRKFKKKMKIHLCDKCYRELARIAERYI